MGLRDQIPNDIKEALREKNSLKLSVLRMLQSAIRNKEIEKKVDELDDQGVIEVVSSEVKKRRDAKAEFEKVNRPDAAQAEAEEIEILMHYMPEQLSTDEIRSRVQKVIDDTGAQGLGDIGRVMKVIMPELKGKADGQEINRVVRELLGEA